MLAALIIALGVAAGLTGGLVYALKKLSDAHATVRAHDAERAQAQRDLFESKTHEALVNQSNHDFQDANATLAAEVERLNIANASEHSRALRAERQRDDLIRQLAAKQDPAALVASINDELAQLTATK